MTRESEQEPVDARARSHAPFITAVTGLLIFSLVFVPLRSSLWLDELVTWWVVKDDFSTMVHRAMTYQQSPLYYVFAWASRSLLGSGEIALRLPSLLAAAGTALLLVRLARRLIGADTARLVLLALALSPWVAFASSDARPYSLAIFASVASAVALVSWLDRGSVRPACLFVLFAAATLWAQYLFAPALAAQLVYAIVRIRRGDTAVRLVQLSAASVAIGLLMVPLMAQLLSLWGRRGELSIPADASFEDVWFFLIPPATAVGVLAGLGFARITGPVETRAAPIPRDAIYLLLPWALGAPVLYSLGAALTQVDFLSKRYWFSATPALAILLAWFLAAIQPVARLRIVAAAMAVAAILTWGGQLKNGEDWRGAIAAVNARSTQDTPVLMHAGLIESIQPDWLSDPEKLSYLLSPISMYPVTGQTVLLPYQPDDRGRARVEQILADEVAGADRFLLVLRRWDSSYSHWFDGRMRADGWGIELVGTFGVIGVYEFTAP